MFKKGNKLWDNSNSKRNWIKKGIHFSPKTEFKKGQKNPKEWYKNRKAWSKGRFKKDRAIMVPCACGCGRLRYKYDKQGRERKYINGHDKKGHTVSKETIKNLILSNKRRKGKLLTREHIEKIRKARAKQTFSKRDRKKMSKSKIRYFKEHPEEKERMRRQAKEYNNKPFVKEKFKELRKKIILPIKDTKIEVKIQNFLKQLGIEFFTHQHLNIKHGYQCDIFIPSMNLVIECDGIYWHKYPTRRDIDNIRTKELIEKGFKVLRLWEFEINEMSIDKFKSKLEDKK